jgi:hypothetical protein
MLNCFEPYKEKDRIRPAMSGFVVLRRWSGEFAENKGHIPTRNSDPEDSMNVRQNGNCYRRTILSCYDSRINILEYSGPHMVHTLENLMVRMLKELSGNTILILEMLELRICVMMEQ